MARLWLPSIRPAEAECATVAIRRQFLTRCSSGPTTRPRSSRRGVQRRVPASGVSRAAVAAQLPHATPTSAAHYGVGKRGAAPLAASLRLAGQLVALDLSDNGLGAEGVEVVLRGPATRRALTARRPLATRRADGAVALGELPSDARRAGAPAAPLSTPTRRRQVRGGGGGGLRRRPPRRARARVQRDRLEGVGAARRAARQLYRRRCCSTGTGAPPRRRSLAVALRDNVATLLSLVEWAQRRRLHGDRRRRAGGAGALKARLGATLIRGGAAAVGRALPHLEAIDVSATRSAPRARRCSRRRRRRQRRPRLRLVADEVRPLTRRRAAARGGGRRRRRARRRRAREAGVGDAARAAEKEAALGARNLPDGAPRRSRRREEGRRERRASCRGGAVDVGARKRARRGAAGAGEGRRGGEWSGHRSEI